MAADHLTSTPNEPAAGLLTYDRLEPGDPVAPFILPDASGTQWSPLDNDIAGKPLLLLLHLAGTEAEVLQGLSPYLALKDQLHSLGCTTFALTCADIAPQLCAALPRSEDGKPIVTVLTDGTGEVFRAYGLDPTSSSSAVPGPSLIALLLNANLKVAFIGASPPGPQRMIEELQRQARARPPIPLSTHPPILLVPMTLSPADCTNLVQFWHGLDHEHDARGHSDVDANCISFLHEYGRVKQYLVEHPTLKKALDTKISRRLIPEISKAFDTRAPQRENWALSCYDAADSGRLGPHRDCASPETQHRRFTVSIALNDTFQGGALRFREYGEQTYNLPIGTAAVFSAALLHEVLPITAGRRFTLLTHLYGT